MDGSTVLRVEALSKEQILSDVSFTLESGDMVAIMGPSGSGKSTLLYNVAGMDTPSSGQVSLRDYEITGLSEDEKATLRLQRMGFVFQQMNMLKNLNILDNIMLPAVLANKEQKRKPRNTAAGEAYGGPQRTAKTKATIKDDALKLMAKLSIADYGERSITEVSGGQLQRACICRSLINEPDILFADEPTGALNKRAAEEVLDEFVKLNREGVTILLVTHDSKVASRCKRVLYLSDGRLEGEYELPNVAPEEKEAHVNRWLQDMGW